jgi:hypothetical protein
MVRQDGKAVRINAPHPEPRHNPLGPRAYPVLTACIPCVEINRAGDVGISNSLNVVPWPDSYVPITH